MLYRAFLARIRNLFRSAPNTHFQLIEDAFRNGELKLPVRPMNDHELAQALREFQQMPASTEALRKLGHRFEGK